MTKKEYDSLPVKKKIRVRWGGKEYMLVRKDIRGTVYLQPIDRQKNRPYPTSYERVEIIK